MQTIERQGDSATRPIDGPPAADAGGGDLDGVRHDVDQFHQAGADAIERALSHDSLGFMNSVRQEQGQ